METNGYQVIKKQIMSSLDGFPKPLEEGKIETTIEDMKGTLKIPSVLEYIAKLNSIELIEPLDEKQWERMIKELESDYDVEAKIGVVVTGEKQKKQDNTWWSLKRKLEQENYYSELYRNYMSKSLPSEVLKSIDEDTDVVMNHIGNPEETYFERYGMVVGHVQSGKTGNYSNLVCKAADAGYKFIVVIAGSMNNLRNQTQERINATFIGRDLNERVGVGKLAHYQEGKRPISLTSTLKDFNKADADRNSQGMSLDTTPGPIIVVIKKNTKTLENVISWLKNHYTKGVVNHSMLLIDDESDYASINTKEENNPTKINEKIRVLLKLFRKSSYVAYTATPYANIFIDHQTETEELGKDLFPDDFIYALNAPSNYFGAEKIFLDVERKAHVEVKDAKDIIPSSHKKNYRIKELPKSLEDAIRLFIINIGIRHLRHQENQHNSMLIHITRFTAVHQNIAEVVGEYYKVLKKNISTDGKKYQSEKRNEVINDIKNTFEYHHKNVEFTWEEIISKVTDVITNVMTEVQIFEVHKDTKLKLEYRNDIATNAIVIGGTSLSRGYTLEGLSVSYFLRNTVFYDTLMQMGRWFGYRGGYEDLCKIYTTKEIFSNFKTIIEATIDLVEDLKEMSRNEMTPRDFGLAVKQHPDSGLQVTARNKLKNAGLIDFEMKLDGHLKETSWICKDESINIKNTEVIMDLVNRDLGSVQPKKPRYWTNVNKKLVVNFLEKFKTYQPKQEDDLGMRTKMPIKFIKEYVDQVDTNWDIALYSGTGDPEIKEFNVKYQARKVSDRGDFYEVEHRQVSSGNAEEIALNKSIIEQIKEEKEINTAKRNKQKEQGVKDLIQLFSVRKAIRNKMKRPLLMLHLIDATITNDDSNRKGEHVQLAAFGISFPGGIQSSFGNVKLQVNTVYIEQMLDEEDGDD
ncbi:Z1 domain-containing protein [Planococcus sp. N064]|uniref:Z1 domain-containing protein n=1 Tax=Planococcus liqunii TaxID=3058394 RepID=A0ABT8MSJ0_9BACL|nr:Z1 domain-containing protein [Planococcus sp. N064]MDN7227871.1 Z1 domain-containing protein [Planococcus sp. N064]